MTRTLSIQEISALYPRQETIPVLGNEAVAGALQGLREAKYRMIGGICVEDPTHTTVNQAIAMGELSQSAAQPNAITGPYFAPDPAEADALRYQSNGIGVWAPALAESHA